MKSANSAAESRIHSLPLRGRAGVGALGGTAGAPPSQPSPGGGRRKTGIDVIGKFCPPRLTACGQGYSLRLSPTASCNGKDPLAFRRRFWHESYKESAAFPTRAEKSASVHWKPMSLSHNLLFPPAN